MKQVVIENPIQNSPYEEPKRHFKFSDEGITNEIVDERCISSYFVPIPSAKKKNPKQLAFETEWRKRVALWRQGGYLGVIASGGHLFEEWRYAPKLLEGVLGITLGLLARLNFSRLWFGGLNLPTFDRAIWVVANRQNIVDKSTARTSWRFDSVLPPRHRGDFDLLAPPQHRGDCKPKWAFLCVNCDILLVQHRQNLHDVLAVVTDYFSTMSWRCYSSEISTQISWRFAGSVGGGCFVFGQSSGVSGAMKQTTIPTNKILTWQLNSDSARQRKKLPHVFFARVSSFLFAPTLGSDLE